MVIGGYFWECVAIGGWLCRAYDTGAEDVRIQVSTLLERGKATELLPGRPGRNIWCAGSLAGWEWGSRRKVDIPEPVLVVGGGTAGDRAATEEWVTVDCAKLGTELGRYLGDVVIPRVRARNRELMTMLEIYDVLGRCQRQR